MNTTGNRITLKALLEHILQLSFIQKESSLHAPEIPHSMNQSLVGVWGQSGDLLQKNVPDPNSNANMVHPLTTTRRLCKELLSMCCKVRIYPTVND